MASDGVTSEKALNLGPITESHAGNYTCYVVNPYGNASYTAIVSVTGEFSSIFKFSTPRIDYVAACVDPKLAGSGPIFIITASAVSAVSVLLVAVAVLGWKYRSAKASHAAQSSLNPYCIESRYKLNMWFVLAQRELGGVTQKQIQRFLEGDKVMAERVPEGPEKAKMLEFVKFVPLRDLRICKPAFVLMDSSATTEQFSYCYLHSF